MISYKVVYKKLRYGSNAGLFIHSNGVERLITKINSIENLKKYFPIYEKGKYIDYVEGSVGLMCFDCEKYAIEFLNNCSHSPNFEIIKVRLNKRNIIKDPKKIISSCGADITRVLMKDKDLDEYDTMVPVLGSIFTKRLFVLE